jgi:hypothetical protein
LTYFFIKITIAYANQFINEKKQKEIKMSAKNNVSQFKGIASIAFNRASLILGIVGSGLLAFTITKDVVAVAGPVTYIALCLAARRFGPAIRLKSALNEAGKRTGSIMVHGLTHAIDAYSARRNSLHPGPVV